MKKILIFIVPFLMLQTVGCAENNDDVYHADCLVTFVNYDGKILYKTSVKYGEDAIYRGETPTRPSSYEYITYVFDGWDRNLTNVQKGFTTKAQFLEVCDETHPEYTNCNLKMQEVAGGYDIKAITKCEMNKKMVLPDCYKGKRVVSIGNGRNRNTLDDLCDISSVGVTGIKFPTYLKSIGFGSFNSYNRESNLLNLEFPDELETIGDWAFKNIYSLKKIKCGSKLKLDKQNQAKI